MAEYSGVAAVLPQAGPAHEKPAGEQMMDMMERILAVKSAKQQMATTQLEQTMKMVQAGFTPDEKRVTKLIKQSGIPISTKPEDMLAEVAASKSKKSGTDAFSGEGGVASGAKKTADAKAQAQTSPLPPDASPQQKHEYFLTTIAKQARQRMNMTAATDEQKAENELLVSQLQNRALHGDDQAMGTLIRNGFGKFDMNFEQWSKLDEVGKQKAADILAGAETDGQKADRGTKIGESLLTSGKVTNPADAFKAGKDLAEGGDTKVQMKPFSFKEIAEQSDIANNIVQLGVPSALVGKVIKAAMAGGLENALPSGLKPIVLRSLSMQQEQLNIEQQRANMDIIKYTQETAKLDKLTEMEKNKQLGEEGKQTMEMFRAALDAKRAGAPFPKDMMTGLYQKVAALAGMDMEEVEHWYGTTYSFVPHLTDKGKSVVDKAAGEPLKTTSPSTLETITKGAKKAAAAAVGDIMKYGKDIDEGKYDKKKDPI